jgi:hypothetical protein
MQVEPMVPGIVITGTPPAPPALTPPATWRRYFLPPAPSPSGHPEAARFVFHNEPIVGRDAARNPGTETDGSDQDRLVPGNRRQDRGVHSAAPIQAGERRVWSQRGKFRDARTGWASGAGERVVESWAARPSLADETTVNQ